MAQIDLPSLQHAIHDLENSLDMLEAWLLVMTGLVVLGLVLEYWHEIPEATVALKEAWSWKPLLVIVGGVQQCPGRSALSHTGIGDSAVAEKESELKWSNW